MRTLQVAFRVTDRDASVTFYTALGYEVIGEAPDTPLGHLTMLKLPGDDYVSLELVHDPSAPPVAETSLSHVAVQVEFLEDTVSRLAAAGIRAEPIASPGPGLHTTCITDPDGRRIELVQWPPGHPDDLPPPIGPRTTRRTDDQESTRASFPAAAAGRRRRHLAARAR